MELFYHVSRDIELPRANRRVRAEPEFRACEACGAELEPDETSEGAAGLAFCADCRDRVEQSAIQIHFRDGCGISVPLGAVEGGTALAGDGRILCVGCRGESGAARRRRWLVLVAAALIALGIGLAVRMWVW